MPEESSEKSAGNAGGGIIFRHCVRSRPALLSNTRRVVRKISIAFKAINWHYSACEIPNRSTPKSIAACISRAPTWMIAITCPCSLSRSRSRLASRRIIFCDSFTARFNARRISISSRGALKRRSSFCRRAISASRKFVSKSAFKASAHSAVCFINLSGKRLRSIAPNTRGVSPCPRSFPQFPFPPAS